MTGEQLDEKAIFNVARKIASPDARAEYLQQACGTDESLQARVEILLRAFEEQASFLESPPVNGKSPTIGHPATEQVGDTIGPYKLLQQIGEGGMGVVYMAEQTEPVERRVALKIIRPGMDSRRVIARFEAERQALAMMDHPHIAKVLDAGTTDTSRPYFVMELVKGVPITEYCDQHQLTLRERLQLFVPVCQAVQHAHQKGIIHRDIKPNNVLVAEYDNRAVPKVIDFGVAKATAQRLTERTMFTEFGQVLGTMEYMSPEQAKLNQLDIDTRTDVYSLGVLLYELLTGETPFDRERLRSAAFDELLRIIREEEPPRPSLRLSTSESLPSIAANRQLEPRKLSMLVHGELDWIVMKALEKDRSRRYETANGMAADIGRYLADEPVTACPPSAGYRLRKLAIRNKAAMATAALILLMLLLGVISTSWQAMRATRQRDRAMAAEELAETEAARATEEAERAKQQSQRATAEAKRAERQSRVARRNQYIAEMVDGEGEIANKNHGGLYARLVDYLPLPGEDDLRDWEWYYLMSVCRPEIRALSNPGRTTNVSWSPDGRHLGTGGAIWDARTGERLRRFVTSWIARCKVAWSPDSTKFAWTMTADENAFYVWDRSTDSVNRFAGHTFSVLAVAWSPDSSQIASGSHDGTIRVWDVATKTAIWTSPTEQDALSLSWSPDGKLLAAGIYWSGTQVWDVTTRQIAAELRNDRVDFHSVSWHPQGNVLAASEVDRWYLLSRDNWTVVHQQSLSRGGRDVSFSPDGLKIAVTDGEAVTVWDDSGEAKLVELQGHRTPVVSVSWGPDSRQLATSDEAGDIKVWHLDEPVQPPPITTDGPIRSLGWLKNDHTLVTFDRDGGSTSWWNVRDGTLQQRRKSVLSPPFQLSADGRLAAVNSAQEDAIEVLDTGDGSTHALLPVDPDRTLVSYSLSTFGKRLITQSFEDQETFLTFWAIGQSKKSATWQRDRPYPSTDYRLFTWDPSGLRIATVGKADLGDDGSLYLRDHLHIFDAIDGKRLFKWKPQGNGQITAIAWRRDGRLVAMGTSEGRLEIVDWERHRQVCSRKLDVQEICALAWHPSHERLICGSIDGKVKLITGSDGRALLELAFNGKRVTHLAWSDDGNLLAAANEKGQVQIWDASRAHTLFSDDPRRRELALAYLDRIRHTSGDDEEKSLRQFLRYAPDTLDFWQARGSAWATLGDFERAFKDFSKGIEPNIQYAFFSARCGAYALLGAKHLEQYRKACTQLVEAFHDSPVPSNQAEVAWLCCLLPHKGHDTSQVVKMAQRSFDDPEEHGNDRRTLIFAAALFRDGQLDESVRLLTELATKLDRGGDSTDQFELACASYFLSLSHVDSGNPSEARRFLESANETAGKYPRGSYSYWNWMNPVVFDALRAEAESRLQPN